MSDLVLNDPPTEIVETPSGSKRKRDEFNALIVLESVVEDRAVEPVVAPEVAGISSSKAESHRRKRTRRKKNLGKEVVGSSLVDLAPGESAPEGATRKGKGKEKAPAQPAKPASVPKVAKEKKTKRGHGFDSFFADGRFVVVKVPDR